MAYGLSTRMFFEGGPGDPASRNRPGRSTARSWQALNEACRLALVEQALQAANDGIDGFPIAL